MPENRPGPKRKFIFQPPMFRCYVSFREGMSNLHVVCKVSLRVLAAWSDQFKQVVTINSFQGPAETTTHPSKRRRPIHINETIQIHIQMCIYIYICVCVFYLCKANKIMTSNMEYSLVHVKHVNHTDTKYLPSMFSFTVQAPESEHVVLPSGGAF